MEAKHFALAALCLAAGAAAGYAAGRRRRRRVEAALADEEHLAWLQRLSTIGQMMSSVVHEVRTPLATVGLTLELASRTVEKGGDPRPHLATAGREADRAVEILSDILDFAKPTPLDLKPASLESLIKSALDPIWIRFDERSVDVWVEVPADIQVLASARHFHQVVTILLMNALDALPFGGRLEITAKRKGGAVRVDIRDNGVGLEPEAIKRLFQPFATGKGEQGGTGLGLNVARWLMTKHGGDVAISSGGIGKGVTVTLTLKPA
jgi:signal transduction histidine kinase